MRHGFHNHKNSSFIKCSSNFIPAAEPEPIEDEQFENELLSIPERKTKYLPGEKLLKQLKKQRRKEREEAKLDVSVIEKSIQGLLREFR